MALSVGNNSTGTTFSGMLKGVGSLNKVGSGAMLLSGSNTYAGGTAVNAGTLEAAGTASLPGYATPGKIAAASGATLAVSPAAAVGRWQASARC